MKGAILPTQTELQQMIGARDLGEVAGSLIQVLRTEGDYWNDPNIHDALVNAAGWKMRDYMDRAGLDGPWTYRGYGHFPGYAIFPHTTIPTDVVVVWRSSYPNRGGKPGYPLYATHVGASLYEDPDNVYDGIEECALWAIFPDMMAATSEVEEDN